MAIGQKFIHLVDKEKAGDAQYAAFSEIPSVDLTKGTTVRFMPGVYEMGFVNNADGISFEGIGNSADVVLCNLVLGNACANTLTFINLTLSGNSSVAASSGKALYVTNAMLNAGAINLKGVSFARADFGVDNHSNWPISGRFCDFTKVDRAIRSNSNVDFAFTEFNVSANAAFTGANSAPIKGFTYLASNTTNSNTGNTVKIVRAMT